MFIVVDVAVVVVVLMMVVLDDDDGDVEATWSKRNAIYRFSSVTQFTCTFGYPLSANSAFTCTITRH